MMCEFRGRAGRMRGGANLGFDSLVVLSTTTSSASSERHEHLLNERTVDVVGAAEAADDHDKRSRHPFLFASLIIHHLFHYC